MLGQHAPCIWPPDHSCGASWSCLLSSIVIQWDLIWTLGAIEAESSLGPQRVPPILKCACQFARSFFYNLFQRGWRPAVVRLQLENGLKEMGLECSWGDVGESQTIRKGLVTDGCPSGESCGGLGGEGYRWGRARRQRARLGWEGVFCDKQAGRLLHRSREIQLPIPNAGLIPLPSTPWAFDLLISEEVYSLTIRSS